MNRVPLFKIEVRTHGSEVVFRLASADSVRPEPDAEKIVLMRCEAGVFRADPDQAAGSSRLFEDVALALERYLDRVRAACGDSTPSHWVKEAPSLPGEPS